MYICNSCRMNGMAECEDDVVSAGEVSSGLAACGYETATMRLPKLVALDQRYEAGFCPNCALEKGTLFPELVSEY